MRRTLAFTLAALASLAVAGCSPVGVPKTDLADTQPIVWPEAPEPPRIRFVRSLTRPEDLGIRKGVLQRLADLVFGASEVKLVRPMGVVAVGQVLFVADPGAQAVHRFDPNDGRHDLIRAADGSALPSPIGLAADAGGTVYVTDSARRSVFAIAPGTKTATVVALQAKLAQPTGIALDAASGRLFVVDTSAHQVKIFARDGRLLATFGRRGAGDGEFNYPTLLWRSAQGRLYVTDSLNFRVQIFDDDGKYLGKFGRPGDGTGDLARHKGVATDSYGHVYVVDSLLPALQVFKDDGQLLLSIGGMGRAPGEFWLPAGIFIGDENLIYVADSYNRRVQIFRYIGGPT